MSAADKAAAFAAASMRMGYAPLITQLTAGFGAPFEMTHTGGNCWSIIARMALGDRTVDVYIGDATEPISPEPDREQYAGFGVVVYELRFDPEFDEMVSVAVIAEQGSTFAVVADVPSMVRMALVEAASGRTRIEL